MASPLSAELKQRFTDAAARQGLFEPALLKRLTVPDKLLVAADEVIE